MDNCQQLLPAICCLFQWYIHGYKPCDDITLTQQQCTDWVSTVASAMDEPDPAVDQRIVAKFRNIRNLAVASDAVFEDEESAVKMWDDAMEIMQFAKQIQELLLPAVPQPEVPDEVQDEVQDQEQDNVLRIFEKIRECARDMDMLRAVFATRGDQLAHA